MESKKYEKANIVAPSKAKETEYIEIITKCGDEKLEVKKQKTKIDESILKIDNNKNK